MLHRIRWLATLALAVILGLPTARASDTDFKARFAKLAESQPTTRVSMKPGEDPAAGAPAVENVTTSRTMPGMEPATLTGKDMQAVLTSNMFSVRSCYAKQLTADPTFADALIIDVAIRNTGRVGDVSVSPGRVKRSVLGSCLMSEVSKWRFPKFSGELEDGIVEQVVNASFPLQFAPAS